MISKKIIIPSLFLVLLVTLFLIFGAQPARKPAPLEAHQSDNVAP
jgi:hypothetical protein